MAEHKEVKTSAGAGLTAAAPNVAGWPDGFKVTDKHLCGYGGYSYRVGAIHKVEGMLEMCGNGLHYCENVVDCVNMTTIEHIPHPHRYLRVTPLSAPMKGQRKNCTAALRVDAEVRTTDFFKMLYDAAVASDNKKHWISLFVEAAGHNNKIFMNTVLAHCANQLHGDLLYWTARSGLASGIKYLLYAKSQLPRRVYVREAWYVAKDLEHAAVLDVLNKVRPIKQ